MLFWLCYFFDKNLASFHFQKTPTNQPTRYNRWFFARDQCTIISSQARASECAPQAPTDFGMGCSTRRSAINYFAGRRGCPSVPQWQNTRTRSALLNFNGWGWFLGVGPQWPWNPASTTMTKGPTSGGWVWGRVAVS